MAIQIFNSLGRKKEPFIPQTPGKVGIYVCGVTVYDECHVGHARVMVVFDVVVRYLRAQGLEVTYVRNFTDIDDKIIQRAAELGISISTLTETHIQRFYEDMDRLHVGRADIEPKATQHLAQMQTMIAQLLANGLAYQSGGDVYFSVERFGNYGQLSGKNLDDLVAGSRVEVDQHKTNPLDFVLWKKAKPGEPQWPSPWGAGRPGWHIECSAMSCAYLGDTFDIHGGGQDLAFPHHENEIAQSEGSTGKPWVRYWLHNGFVNVLSRQGEHEKMSKSLGNFFTIRDILKTYRGEVLRFFILNSHYRSPLDFSFELLDNARAGLDRLYSSLDSAEKILGQLPPVELSPITASDFLAEEVKSFFAAMDDDFNTAKALAVLFDMAKKLNRELTQAETTQKNQKITDLAQTIRRLGTILGLLQEKPAEHFRFSPAEESTTSDPTNHSSHTGSSLSPDAIESLILRRAEARKNKNFTEADQVRKELEKGGITLLDTKDGTTWRRIQ